MPTSSVPVLITSSFGGASLLTLMMQRKLSENEETKRGKVQSNDELVPCFFPCKVQINLQSKVTKANFPTHVARWYQNYSGNLAPYSFVRTHLGARFVNVNYNLSNEWGGPTASYEYIWLSQ